MCGTLTNRDYDPEELARRGLVFTGRHLPYNPVLVPRAQELRKNMTPAERKLWFGFLRLFRYRSHTQQVIDHYIVDFYCPAVKLVIEVDGEQHHTEEGKIYDTVRDGVLDAYGLTVMRVTNRDVMEQFPMVCGSIERMFRESNLSDRERRFFSLLSPLTRGMSPKVTGGSPFSFFGK